MCQHTPGPWFYNYDDKCISNQEGVSVVNVRGAMGGEDTNADIALIAAAPAMYEALQKISDLYRKAYESDGEFFLDESEIGSLADAALAQAEGKG